MGEVEQISQLHSEITDILAAAAAPRAPTAAAALPRPLRG